MPAVTASRPGLAPRHTLTTLLYVLALAPGLVLERLMPKYAVMNYRGTRYRVAY